jgi:hypothetical protein
MFIRASQAQRLGKPLWVRIEQRSAAQESRSAPFILYHVVWDTRIYFTYNGLRAICASLGIRRWLHHHQHFFSDGALVYSYIHGEYVSPLLNCLSMAVHIHTIVQKAPLRNIFRLSLRTSLSATIINLLVGSRYHLLYLMFYIIFRFYRCAAGCDCQRWHTVSVIVFESVGGCLNVFTYIPRFVLSLGLHITHGSAYSQFSPCLFSSKSETMCHRVLLAGNL